MVGAIAEAALLNSVAASILQHQLILVPVFVVLGEAVEDRHRALDHARLQRQGRGGTDGAAAPVSDLRLPARRSKLSAMPWWSGPGIPSTTLASLISDSLVAIWRSRPIA